MKSIQKMILPAVLMISTLTAVSQRPSDIGVRINSSFNNRIQVEFRKPVGENYRFRLGGSIGSQSHFPYGHVTDANDSVVVTRMNSQLHRYYDLRIGLERKLKWERLSIHSDLLLGYNTSSFTNSNSYSVLDSSGGWSGAGNPYGWSPNDFSSARDGYLGTGLVFGLSLDLPLSDWLLLNLDASYVGMARFRVSHWENNDVQNEFYDGNTFMLDMYSSLGIGLRVIPSMIKQK